jgi:hypothetical protein
MVVKSPRQLALAEGRGTYVSARQPCRRCGGRKRFTANGACKKCQDIEQSAIRKRRSEHAALLAEANRERDLHPPVSDMCPGCGRPWSVGCN